MKKNNFLEFEKFNSRFVGTKILDSKNTDKDIEEAVEIMERCGALEECHKQANRYLEGARKTLSYYPESEARQLFEELLEYMVTRGH